MTQGQILNTGERGLILQEIIKKYKPQNIVEIGTWKGLGSTFCIIQSLQKDQNFFSLESNRIFHQIAKNNLREYLSDNIKLICGRIVDKKEVLDYVSNIYLDDNQK
jgi:predicted O-methyltransferase YrrM